MSMKTILCAMLAVGLSVSSAYAEPSVKRSGSTITVKEALTDDGISQAKEFAGKIWSSSARPSPMPPVSTSKAKRMNSRASLLWRGSKI